MDNKNRDDVSKSLEKNSLTKSYISEKSFDLLDKSAKGLSNLKSEIKEEKELEEELKKKSEEQENKPTEDNSKEYESRLKTNENQENSNNDSSTNNQSASKLKTGMNNNETSNGNEDTSKEPQVKSSKIKTAIYKGTTKVFGFDEAQGKISKTVTVVSKTGKGLSKVSRKITRASKDLDKAMSSDGTGRDFLQTKVNRNTKKVIQKKIIPKVKKPVKKVVKKVTSPITAKISQAFRVVMKKAIKLLISGISAISEFILPIALIILVIVSICSIFSWGSGTTNNYQNYMDTIQAEYDKQVDDFIRENPTGIVVGVRGGYGKINWRVPFSIMQGVGAEINLDNSEKQLIEQFKNAGLLEKHEIIEQTVKTGEGEYQTETTKKIMIITNAGLEEYLEYCKNNFNSIKTFMNNKKILGFVENDFDALQLETTKSLYLSDNAFDEFAKKYADYTPKYGFNNTERNLDSNHYNSNNTLATSGFKGQCTWYSFGRALESTGKVMPTGNAQTWLSSAVGMGYSTGSYPVPNSVVVLAGRKFGHVAYVESYDGEKITISEGNVGNACSDDSANCSQVEYANNHANELVRTKTYNSFKEYKEASKASGLYVVGFIYLD